MTSCDHLLSKINPISELLYITDLEKTTSNDGWTDINPIDFYDNDDGAELRSIQLGLIKINLTNPEQAIPGLRTSPYVLILQWLSISVTLGIMAKLSY